MDITVPVLLSLDSNKPLLLIRHHMCTEVLDKWLGANAVIGLHQKLTLPERLLCRLSIRLGLQVRYGTQLAPPWHPSSRT